MRQFLFLFGGLTAIIAFILILGMVLHAPIALAVAAWIVFPVAFGVLVAQLAKTHRTPPPTPKVILHEDGSVEVRP